MSWVLEEGVTRGQSCDLTVVAGAWPYAEANARAIDEHWRAAIAQSPHFFNGTVHMLRRMSVQSGSGGVHFSAELIAVEFKAFLFWKRSGQPDCGYLDAFGSALILGSDGGIVLGRQRDGNVNGGQVYMPGGFIDPRDVDTAGRVSLSGSIEREIAEETGLAVGRDLNRDAGYLLTMTGGSLSIAMTYRAASLTAAALAERIAQNIGGDAVSELVGVEVAYAVTDLSVFDMPPFARLCAAYVLGQRAGADRAGI